MNPGAKANIFTIAPGAPFLPTLAERLVDGTLVPGFHPAGDPLALASVTIYVPTRRAARALRSEFASRSGTGAAILPTIRPLGEFEEDFEFSPGRAADILGFAEPIGAEERVLQLARLVRQWSQEIPKQTRMLFQSDPMVLPATSADAVWMARDLALLIDEVEREGGDWQQLKSLVPEALAGWWQLTLNFMEIVSTFWPQHLAENLLIDPAAHRIALIRAEAAQLARFGSPGPVIAAGSTGSMPATAELLKTIAHLPQGALVLPGLDLEATMSADAWDSVGKTENAPSAFGHPQFGLHKLLGICGTVRGDVVELGKLSTGQAARNRLVSLALLPADMTDLWAGTAKPQFDLNQVCELVAPSESVEALAIAIALREAVEDGAVPAALVTTNRTLARRVCAELERFGIKADDSGGTPLELTAPATLFQMLLQTVFEAPDPATLLSLFQHPLTALGKTRKQARRGAEVIDLLFLRGEVLPLDLEVILAHLSSARKPLEKGGREYRWTHRFTPDEIETAIDLCQAFCAALEPLQNLKKAGEVSVAEACIASVTAFEALGMDAQLGLSRLYGGDAGERFAEQLRAMCALTDDFRFPPGEWPSVWRAFASGQSVKPRHGSDPRVFVWGALEARLQDLKTVVLGGLNEKSWPMRPSDDPFLSRTMKGGIGLEPPERRTGLAAHDFQMLMGLPNVILSRAARSEGAPTVPSRWLQRLHAVLGAEATEALQIRAAKYLDWAALIDKGEETDRAKPPEPKPPIAIRPVRFSVTDIETLRRDPYAIYAKRVLGLEPVPNLVREADARERGNLFHKILEEFVIHRGAIPGDRADLLKIGQAHFQSALLPPETYAVWWRRFEKTVEGFLSIEADRAASIRQCHVELKSAALPIDGTNATLSGRADRIDVLRDGTAAILDYKTGSGPSLRQARALLAPQLPLEAALMARGGFAGLMAMETSHLAYMRLKANGDVSLDSLQKAPTAKGEGEVIAAELGEHAWKRLCQLIVHFDNPDTPYRSHILPVTDKLTGGDYDHLARVLEWSSGADGDNEGETE